VGTILMNEGGVPSDFIFVGECKATLGRYFYEAVVSCRDGVN
jgi:hypothetical protein